MWVAVIVISIVGTLFHFLYEWSHHNEVVSLFAAVNESTWEHIKIALTPTILYSLYDGFLYGMNPNYFWAKLLSLMILIVVIPLIFYSYTALIKKHNLWIDIATFYLAIILSQYAFYAILKLPSCPFWISYLSAVGTFCVFGLYMSATLLPLKTFLFKDPLTNKYGVDAHKAYDKQTKRHEHK